MHIPDGFLSPTTCAALYGGAVPFWWVSLRRTGRAISVRMIPTLSVLAAFSFVVMMFNVPLPGGTTGHAVGMGISSILLGPWASMLAISIALFIQALFFGDGGITTFGANSFNMAIVGSLVAYGVYKALSAGAGVKSARRVFAAAAGGYLAINMAALCAAIEFGIQPIFFKTATGTPLYCPFPLRIAVPVMMIGHLTFAGLAEAIVTGGVFAYLQKTNSSLLDLASARAFGRGLPAGDALTAGVGSRSPLRPLRVGLALMLLITPIGLLAAGSAWGEWSPADFTTAEGRKKIAEASRNYQVPGGATGTGTGSGSDGGATGTGIGSGSDGGATGTGTGSGSGGGEGAPAGLVWLSKVWTAPMSHYSPPFMRSPTFGYLMSGMIGAGLIALSTNFLGRIVGRLARGAGRQPQEDAAKRGPPIEDTDTGGDMDTGAVPAMNIEGDEP